ncbi:hypothetical protein CYMTET_56490 [Cymbomonas tetramitiformis]|uniref:Uncharacterized protein n=1 Tax=Cymbomonas tetramitiformis TaxID=36881 RepID=A0AAE0BCJ8_9CHLO|nr:hypothetical protein CYMTET_56490 [Cymbomonas tetramitiformis]
MINVHGHYHVHADTAAKAETKKSGTATNLTAGALLLVLGGVVSFFRKRVEQRGRKPGPSSKKVDFDGQRYAAGGNELGYPCSIPNRNGAVTAGVPIFQGEVRPPIQRSKSDCTGVIAHSLEHSESDVSTIANPLPSSQPQIEEAEVPSKTAESPKVVQKDPLADLDDDNSDDGHSADHLRRDSTYKQLDKAMAAAKANLELAEMEVNMAVDSYQSLLVEENEVQMRLDKAHEETDRKQAALHEAEVQVERLQRKINNLELDLDTPSYIA